MCPKRPTLFLIQFKWANRNVHGRFSCYKTIYSSSNIQHETKMICYYFIYIYAVCVVCYYYSDSVFSIWILSTTISARIVSGSKPFALWTLEQITWIERWKEYHFVHCILGYMAVGPCDQWPHVEIRTHWTATVWCRSFLYVVIIQSMLNFHFSTVCTTLYSHFSLFTFFLHDFRHNMFSYSIIQ